MDALSTATIVNGLVLGWSVAWPPGPINAEMIRRALLPRAQGGRILARPGSSASAPARAISSGRWAWRPVPARLLASPRLHLTLGVISFLLLLFLAFNFARGAWQVAHAHRSVVDQPVHRPSVSRGYFLGLILALTSPWNVGFWFAVVGGQGAAQGHTSFLGSLTLAAAVVSGAIAWTIVLCTALKLGARIFARPAWQAGTQAVSALVMLVFAARLVWLWR